MAADPEESENCHLVNSEKWVDEDDGPFQEVFYAQREKIKACIRSIRKIADDIDKTHKDCVIASIAASSFGATSETLNVLGSALTPQTASGSLILTAVALSFRIAETVISVSSSLYEKVVNSRRKEEAQALINQCNEVLPMAKGPDEPAICSNMAMSDQEDILKYLASVKEWGPALYKNVQEIQTNVKTLHCLQADPHLKALAKQATTASKKTRGNIQGIKEVDKKCAGTVLAKNEEERLHALGAAACDLLVKAKTIYQCCQQLSSGAKTEVAATIRAKATKLEEALERLTKVGKQPLK